MITKILIEVVLGLIVFFSGGLFWQLRKRAQFLAHVIGNEPFLAQIISRGALDNASPMITPFAEKRVTYALNVKMVIDADIESQRRTKLIFVAILVATITGSWFVSPLCLLINIFVFFLSGATSISPSAQSNAVQHILAIALILDRWRAENLGECDEWIQQVPNLQPIYNVVKIV